MRELTTNEVSVVAGAGIITDFLTKPATAIGDFAINIVSKIVSFPFDFIACIPRKIGDLYDGLQNKAVDGISDFIGGNIKKTLVGAAEAVGGTIDKLIPSWLLPK